MRTQILWKIRERQAKIKQIMLKDVKESIWIKKSEWERRTVMLNEPRSKEFGNGRIHSRSIVISPGKVNQHWMRTLYYTYPAMPHIAYAMMSHWDLLIYTGFPGRGHPHIRCSIHYYQVIQPNSPLNKDSNKKGNEVCRELSHKNRACCTQTDLRQLMLINSGKWFTWSF